MLPKAAVCGLLVALCACLPSVAAEQPTITIQQATTAIGFDPADGYAVSALVHRGQGFNFVAPRPAGKLQDRSPWMLTIRLASGAMMTLTTANARSVAREPGPSRVVVTWRGITSPDCIADLTVKMTVFFTPDQRSHWQLAVEGQAPGALWQVDYPRLAGLRPVGEDALLTPLYLGRLTRDPARRPARTVIGYPSPLSMQFFACYGTPDRREPNPGPQGESGWTRNRQDAIGLYWATEDGSSYYKRFGVDSTEIPDQLRVWVENVPPLPRWPVAAGAQSISYRLPYDFVLRSFTGDAGTAASLYRDWARRQSWCSRGPADKWPKSVPKPGSPELVHYTPSWFRNVGFWAKFYREPAKVVPEWAAYARWLQVPIASHYYRSPIARFDDNYPEMLPTHPYYISGVRDARDMDVHPLPYTNGVIWDQDTQSYIGEGGEAAAVKDEHGAVPVWDIGGEIYSYMCPGAKQWRDTVARTAYKQVVEHGLSGVYLDCLTATASMPCYDPTHGHSLRGGAYYAEGQHRMMVDLRRQVREVDPSACFFPEECGEWVIDAMDGFLTLDISRGYPTPGQQVFPLFPLVYHAYTINFGDDVTLDYAADRFAWEFGTMFTWGAVPLFSPPVAQPPREGDANSEMLREIVQAYYVAGLPFLQGGEAVGITVRPPQQASARASLDLAVAERRFDYQPRPNVTRTWSGPAVLASAWRRGSDVAVAMVNITAQDQALDLGADPAALGLPAPARLLRTWPRAPRDLGPAAGHHRFTVPARKVVIVVLTADTARAGLGRKLLDPSWQLLTADDGAFAPFTTATNRLWACSDGPLRNLIGRTGGKATPLAWDDTGAPAPRVGLRPKEAEGVALPRLYSRKPFLLIRPLPVRTVPTRASEELPAIVYSGDDQHLLAGTEGGGLVEFGSPGLLVVTGSDGKILRPLEAGRTTQVLLPAGKRCWVGYAVPDVSGLGTLLQTADAASRAQLKVLATACQDLWKTPSAARLAAASRALGALERGLQELPGALAPETPLYRLHLQLQALVGGYLGGPLLLEADDDWLAPALPKTLTARRTGWKVGIQSGAPQVALLGDWPPAALRVGAARLTRTPWAGAPRHDFEVVLDAPAYAERMVPAIAWATVAGAGQRFEQSAVLHLEANRPLELQTQSAPVLAVAGRTVQAQATLRNWSTSDLRVTVRAQAPQGWVAAGPVEPLEVPAGQNRAVTFTVTPPSGTPRASVSLRVAANYAAAGPTVAGNVIVNVQPRLVPLQPSPASWSPTVPAEPACYRMHARLAVHAEAGRPLRLTINNRRVTQYTNSTAYRLLDPELKPVRTGKVDLDKSGVVEVAQPSQGAWFLELDPLQGSATVETAVRGVAELATAADPLALFCSPITRWFFVPAGSASFRLGAQDGGPDEGARFTISSPTGRIAFERDGNYNGGETEVAVRPEEAGKVWRLRVEPRQDITFWLTGGVCPYLSEAPERVLIDAATAP